VFLGFHRGPRSTWDVLMQWCLCVGYFNSEKGSGPARQMVRPSYCLFPAAGFPRTPPPHASVMAGVCGCLEAGLNRYHGRTWAAPFTLHLAFSVPGGAGLPILTGPGIELLFFLKPVPECPSKASPPCRNLPACPFDSAACAFRSVFFSHCNYLNNEM